MNVANTRIARKLVFLVCIFWNRKYWQVWTWLLFAQVDSHNYDYAEITMELVKLEYYFGNKMVLEEYKPKYSFLLWLLFYRTLILLTRVHHITDID